MIVAAALIAAVTYRFFELSYVTGNSMEPTYKNGDILLVCKWRSPKSGDIVTAYINDLERVVVKRVVGKPGDWIRYTTKGIYRNGEPVQTDRNPKKQETELCVIFIPSFSYKTSCVSAIRCSSSSFCSISKLILCSL